MLNPKGISALRRASHAVGRTCTRPRAPVSPPARGITANAPSTNEAKTSADPSVIGLPPPPTRGPYEPEPRDPDDILNVGTASAAASEPLPSIPDSMAGPVSAGPSSTPTPDAEPEDMAVARVALRQPWNTSLRRRRHPFDSHKFVSTLEKANLDLETSKALMEAVRGLIVRRTEQSTAKMLSREEADNEAYVFRAALSKLRTEFNVRTRNTGLEARNGVSAVRRGLEHVERKMAGDMQVLKHDVELDMNGSKDENRNGAKMLDLQIEEINSRATISIGDLRTEIESAKWDSTRRAITIIIVLVICGVGISTLTLGEHEQPKPVPPPTPKPEESTTRDVAIGTDDDPYDYEARIDKILSAVPPPESRERKPRRHSKPDVYVDRI